MKYLMIYHKLLFMEVTYLIFLPLTTKVDMLVFNLMQSHSFILFI